MPPSPATRCSPRRESRADNHKRGRSLESGILLRDKDDDLALFNEVQSRERDNFLLQSNDDFEDTFCNPRHPFLDQFYCLFIVVQDLFIFIGVIVSATVADRYIIFIIALHSTATKLRYFSDQKLGISVPIRGESSDLLNAEGEKNDYEWFVAFSHTH